MATTDFAAARENMVNCQVRPTDVTDYALLEAMFDIPRERFVPSSKRFAAYIDEDIDVSTGEGERRYLLEPSPFAKLVQLAAIAPGETVLDVGSTTGYSTAVIARLCGFAIGLESDAELVARSSDTLSELGIDNAVAVHGELSKGYAKEGPYDVIICEGAVGEVPDALIDQLRDGGRLVAVVGHGQAGRARLFVREGSIVSSRPAFNAAIPPLPGFEREAGFVF